MKVLIVDDEKMIRNWLTMLFRQIPGNDIEVNTASTVDEALDYCQHHEVHLVLTDITMPQRSGLELLQILHETRPDIHTAVLSAYDDYHYIRNAMQFGAIDYILKSEMQLSDIVSVLRKVEVFSQDTSTSPAKGTLESNHDYTLADFIDDPSSFETFIQSINPNMEMKDFSVIVFSLPSPSEVHPNQLLALCNKTLISENIVGSIFQMQKSFWVIYNSHHQILEHQKEESQRMSLLINSQLSSLTQTLPCAETTFFASTPETLCLLLKQHLVRLRCCQYYTDYNASNFTTLSHDESRDVIKKLRFMLETHRYTEAADFLHETTIDFHKKSIDPLALKPVLYHCISVIFLNTIPLKNNMVFSSHYQNINRQLNVANTSDKVFTLIDKFCILYKEELKNTKTDTTNPSLRKVLDYIDQNYMQRLTLDKVSQQVYLNKIYISQLFTKHLGVNFVSYLESVRIYKAQELLITSEKSVTKIAEETGYASQSYFTKAFKKRVGMTPLQFRTLTISKDES